MYIVSNMKHLSRYSPSWEKLPEMKSSYTRIGHAGGKHLYSVEHLKEAMYVAGSSGVRLLEFAPGSVNSHFCAHINYLTCLSSHTSKMRMIMLWLVSDEIIHAKFSA